MRRIIDYKLNQPLTLSLSCTELQGWCKESLLKYTGAKTQQSNRPLKSTNHCFDFYLMTPWSRINSARNTCPRRFQSTLANQSFMFLHTGKERERDRDLRLSETKRRSFNSLSSPLSNEPSNDSKKFIVYLVRKSIIVQSLDRWSCLLLKLVAINPNSFSLILLLLRCVHSRS